MAFKRIFIMSAFISLPAAYAMQKEAKPTSPVSKKSERSPSPIRNASFADPNQSAFNSLRQQNTNDTKERVHLQQLLAHLTKSETKKVDQCDEIGQDFETGEDFDPSVYVLGENDFIDGSDDLDPNVYTLGEGDFMDDGDEAEGK